MRAKAFSQKEKSPRQGPWTVPGGIFWLRRTSLVFLITLLICTAIQGVSGQETADLVIQPPDTSAFPLMQVQFKIIAPSANPINTLQPEQLTLYENQQTLPIESLETIYQGVDFYLVLNENRELDLRDANGVSRYQKLAHALENWAPFRTFNGEDSMSLVTNQGIQVSETADADRWLAALEAYDPNFRSLESDLTSLETAIATNLETVTSFGVDKVLLYISPPPTIEQIPILYELAERARAGGIHIHVWMVASELFLTNDQGKALQDLAALTGGQFFGFSGIEAIPNPETYISPFGRKFTLSYTSKIKETGTYPLNLEITLPGLSLSGESQPFYIDVQPPNPIFITPPSNITRITNPEAADPLKNLIPQAFLLDILVQFPDENPREITASRLYVDGELVDENTSFPFDSFVWDLTGYTESGEYNIQAAVIDELGLEARTITLPVQVDILLPEPEEPEPQTKFPLLIGGGVILGSILLLFIIRTIKQIRENQKTKDFKNRFFKRDAKQKSAVSRKGTGAEKPLASLIPLKLGTENAPEVLKIYQQVTTLGKDTQRADLLLSSETAAGLHAKITILNNKFWLKDLGTTAGTRVNYEKIGIKDVQIKTGDLIHFGLNGFRFKIEMPEMHHPAEPIQSSTYEPTL